jgi:xanthine dehydrogenase accessory factor
MRLYTNSAVVALSHSPQFDDPLLACAMESGVGYIGALGSKKSHADRLLRLKKAGFSADQVNRINGPVGLDIGSKTPAEIALSIMAQIVHQKRDKKHDQPKSICMQENVIFAG